MSEHMSENNLSNMSYYHRVLRVKDDLIYSTFKMPTTDWNAEWLNTNC